jgi:predicted transcriptional regulator
MIAKQIAEPVDIFSLEAKEYMPPKWYIENFIPENSGILIGAKPGKKKSLTTMTACLCIPLNCNFLDNFNIINDKAKILYYDLENGEEVIAERFSYLIKSLKEKAKNKNPCNFKLLYSFDKHNLEKEFQTAKNYDIIVLDSYRRVLKGEENNSEITDIFFNDFYKPLRDLKKTVIIIHHFKKGMLTDHEDVDELMDIFRGSSDVAAQFEIIYGILNGKETISVDGNMIETNVFVKCVKNRRGLKIRNFAFNLIKNEKDLRTDFQYLGDIKMKTLKDNKKNILVDIINKKETIHRSELAEIALQNEISIPTMDKYLKELVTTGIIKHDKQGKYESVKVIDIEDKTSMSELL